MSQLVPWGVSTVVLAQMPQRTPSQGEMERVRCQCHHHQGHSSDLGGGLLSRQKTEHFDHHPMGAAESKPEDTASLPTLSPSAWPRTHSLCSPWFWGMMKTTDRGGASTAQTGAQVTSVHLQVS